MHDETVKLYIQFNFKKSYILPIQCIYVLGIDLAINLDYFSIQC